MEPEILLKAIGENDTLQVMLCIQAGIPLNTPINGVLPIEHAIQTQTSLMPLLIEQGASVHNKTQNGYPLHFTAVHANNCDAIDILINHGLSLDATDEKNGTAIMFASCDDGFFRTLKHIVRSGKANINKQNKNGHTALMHSSLSGAKACALTLIAAKARLNIRDVRGDTALDLVKDRFIEHHLLAAGAK